MRYHYLIGATELWAWVWEALPGESEAAHCLAILFLGATAHRGAA